MGPTRAAFLRGSALPLLVIILLSALSGMGAPTPSEKTLGCRNLNSLSSGTSKSLADFHDVTKKSLSGSSPEPKGNFW